MANPDGSWDLELGIKDGTQGIQQGLGAVARQVADVRADVEAWNDSFDGTLERANRLNQILTESKNVTGDLKEVLEIIQTLNLANSQALNSAVMTMGEMMSQARSLSSNPQQMQAAMGMYGLGTPYGMMAGGGGYGFTGQLGTGVGGGPESNWDLNVDPHGLHNLGIASRVAGYVDRQDPDVGLGRESDPTPPTGSGGGGVGGGPSSSPITTTVTTGRRRFLRRRSYGGGTSGLPSLGGGGGSGGGGGGGGYEPYDDWEDHEEEYTTTTTTGAPPPPSGHTRRSVTSNPGAPSTAWAAYLKRNYGDLYDKYTGAGRTRDLNNPADSVLHDWEEMLGTIPGGQKLRGAARVARAVLRQQQKNSDLYEQQDHPSGIPGAKIWVRKDSEQLSGLEHRILNLTESGFGKAITKMLEFGSKIGVAAAVGGAVYNTARGIVAPLQQFNQVAQQQGDVIGLTDNWRTAGMALKAQSKSGWGFNLNYSSQDVMAAMMQGSALGLKGSSLDRYTDQSLQFKKTYGMTAQETGRLTTNAFRYGINQETLGSNMADVRRLANDTNNTSTSYAMQSYMQGSAQAGTLGFASGQAGTAGVLASQFGAGNLRLQGMGATGTEFASSQIGQALIGDSLKVNGQSVGYMGLAGAAMTGKITAGQMAKASDQQLLEIVGGSTGITKKSKKKDLKQGDIPQTIFMIMQSLGFTNIKGPADAVEYLWKVISRLQKDDYKKHKPKEKGIWESIGGAFEGAMSSVTHGVTNAVTGVIKPFAHVANDAMILGEGLVKNQSWDKISKHMSDSNKVIDNDLKNVANTASDAVGLVVGSPEAYKHAANLVGRGAKAIGLGNDSSSGSGGGSQVNVTVNQSASPLLQKHFNTTATVDPSNKTSTGAKGTNTVAPPGSKRN